MKENGLQRPNKHWVIQHIEPKVRSATIYRVRVAYRTIVVSGTGVPKRNTIAFASWAIVIMATQPALLVPIVVYALQRLVDVLQLDPCLPHLIVPDVGDADLVANLMGLQDVFEPVDGDHLLIADLDDDVA